MQVAEYTSILRNVRFSAVNSAALPQALSRQRIIAKNKAENPANDIKKWQQALARNKKKTIEAVCVVG